MAENKDNTFIRVINQPMPSGAPDLYWTEKLSIFKVIYSGPATIVFWSDGSKTVSKCKDGDIYNREFGLYMCIFKKMFGRDMVESVYNSWVKNAERALYCECAKGNYVQIRNLDECN